MNTDEKEKKESEKNYKIERNRDLSYDVQNIQKMRKGLHTHKQQKKCIYILTSR